jgi:hypothetical protein
MEAIPEKHGNDVFTVTMQCMVLLQLIFIDKEHVSVTYEHQNRKTCSIGKNSFGN